MEEILEMMISIKWRLNGASQLLLELMRINCSKQVTSLDLELMILTRNDLMKDLKLELEWDLEMHVEMIKS